MRLALVGLALAGCSAETGSNQSAPDGAAADDCAATSDEALCARNATACGNILVVDACGQTRTVSCGSCNSPPPAGECQAESDAQLCSTLAKECGEVVAVDSCGKPRMLSCGGCPEGQSCGAGGVDNVCASPTTADGWCIPSSSVPSGWSYLDNGIAKVGVNVDHGAAVGHFSAGGVNVLDSNDTGRYLQQSYYGDHMGGSWHGDPWRFNPVQGGSSDEVPSPVSSFCNDGNTLYARTEPLDWGNTGATPSVMEEWIRLEGDTAVFRFRFEYTGAWGNAPAHQEVPAFFVDRDLENLTFYQGGAPWTGAAVTQILPQRLETDGNQYINFDEPWLAYLDSSGWGVGLYKEGEDSATCYRYGDLGEKGSTSYFAFLDTFALTPGLVHEYTLHAKIGTLSDLRAAFAQLHQTMP
jgi:hypothetical protein